MQRMDLGARLWVGCLIVALWPNVTQPIRAADVTLGADIATELQVPLASIDHSPWDRLLHKYVDDAGMVQYTQWKSSAGDVQALDNYLQLLSHSNGQGTREERLAFWINAYNAVTVKGILSEYPTTSIRNHTAVLFGYNIWKNLKLIVSGKPISLEEIEHQVLRHMGEPRVHFAIVCASKGCPKLLNEAYAADRLEEQLTANTRAFFADPSKFQFDAARNRFSLSPVLKWFDEDFGSSQAELLQRISPWLPDASAQQAAAVGSGKVSYLSYDWGLNDRK
jgi:hypothetical protein